MARYDVFMSYHNPEKEAVSWLKSKLLAEGIEVFFDEGVLVAGDSLPSELAEALYESSVCVVLLGPSGIGTWQLEEINIATQRAVDDSTFRVIVLTLPGADHGALPPALRHRIRVDYSAGLDDAVAFRQFVDGIRGRPSTKFDSVYTPSLPPYRSMAPCVEGFVPRPELEAAVSALVREPGVEGESPIAVKLTTELRGAGGFGKTALAQAVCEHEAVRRRYPAGILWSTLGQQLGDTQRLTRVRDLLRWWTRKEPPFYETLEAAAGMLREALAGHAVLLVLDDVWLAADLVPFAGILSPAALLLTTRNTRTLPLDTEGVVVDALQLPRAIELLGQGLAPPPAAVAAERLARRLGEWPILLKLVNAQLREECRDGFATEVALRNVESTLDELGLTAFDREDEESRELAVRRTVEASLQRLSLQDRLRYGMLAVFPEDEQIPLSVLELLWKVQVQEVVRLGRRLAEMSLLYRFDPVGCWIQLHDVMRAFLLREHRDEIEPLNGTFVDSYMAALRREAVQQESESYFVSRLPFHLKSSNRTRELAELLFSYRWLEEKVLRTGVNTAMSDYELLEGNEDADYVRNALRLSRAVLSRDASQLASQLHGRLVGPQSIRIEGLLEGAIARHEGPWLRPLTGSLQKPSGPLIESFKAHQGEVWAIVQLDENRFCTAATDGEIHVWDRVSGELLQTLIVGSPVRHLIATEFNRLLSASDDGIVRLWDLDEEQVIRTFEGHLAPITALRFRRGEFFSGSEDGTLLRWSIDTSKPLGIFRGHTSRINDIGSLDARTIVSVGGDRTLRVWNILSSRALRTLTMPVFAAATLEVTASNEVIVGTFAAEIQIWKPLSKAVRPRRSLKYPALSVDVLRVLRRDLGVSASRLSSEMRLWNPSNATVGIEIHVPGGGVTALARFGANHLLCGSKDGTLSVWTVDSPKIQMNETPAGSIYAIAPVDSTTVVSTSTESSLYVWSAPEGALLRTLSGHSATVNSVCALGPDRVASSSSDSTIRIWNPTTGELLHTLQCSEKPGALAVLERDILVSAPVEVSGEERSIRLWDLVRYQEVVALPLFQAESERFPPSAAATSW